MRLETGRLGAARSAVQSHIREGFSCATSVEGLLVWVREPVDERHARTSERFSGSTAER
jgi:hypothetical protein